MAAVLALSCREQARPTAEDAPKQPEHPAETAAVRAPKPAPAADPQGEPIVTVFQGDDAGGWTPWNQLSPFRLDGKVLRTASLGDDPYIAGPVLKSSVAEVQIRMKVGAGKQGEVFWVTEDDRGWGTQGKSKSFDLTPDNEFHTYRIVCQEKRAVVQLRIDPTDTLADIEIQYIAVVPYGS